MALLYNNGYLVSCLDEKRVKNASSEYLFCFTFELEDRSVGRRFHDNSLLR